MKNILRHFRTNEIVGVCIAISLPLAAYFIKTHFAGTNPAEYTSILTALTALLGGLYGIFWFWPNYLQQKRLDNLIVTTKEALGGALETEEKVKRLFFVHNSQHANIEEQIKAHFDLSYSVTRLKNAILMLQRDSDLVKNNYIQKALLDVNQLEELLGNKNSLRSFSQADLVTQEDLANKSSAIADLIEKLKFDILKIYDLGV